MFDKKILCIGSNNSDTDLRVSKMSLSAHTINHGLISSDDYIPIEYGYYHTSITDLSFGKIIKIAKLFDQIVLLDQQREVWDHWKSLLSSYKIMLELDQLGYQTVFKDNKNVQTFLEFDEFIKNNKSFCIYPWINRVETNGTGTLNICSRSNVPIVKWDKDINWQTNPEFNEVRQKMLRGELLPNHCKVCYDYESRGVESYRIHETKDWISKLNIRSIDDLNNITSPKYYEIRLSNKCNIMCRGCTPVHSHLIDKEFKKFNIKQVFEVPNNYKYSTLKNIDIDTLGPDVRVYLTGGEPTVISEVYRFMELCIAAGKTDFDFTLGTNAVKISNRFLELTDHFTKMNFSVSIDGYGRINDYWRWGSDWDTVIQNTKLLQSRGHSIGINFVPGIYNVTNLHLLYEFLDREFPQTTIYSQLNYVPIQSAWNHPNAELVLESMTRCKQTNLYYSDGKSNRTIIDQFYNHYSNNPKVDLELLKKFFEFNDKLDQARGSRLGDYIPELEECRKYIGAVAEQ